MDMKQLKMVERPISTLKGYDKNPRKNDAVVARMVESINEFGFRIPVVAKSDGSVVDGHLRLKAAQRMGMKSVPVVLADELTDAQVKAFRLLANRSANWADWDDDLLRQELADLKGMDFDLSLTGFDTDEISLMLDIPVDGGLTDPDEVPEPPVVPVTKPGDVWLLGKHRLMCGDSTSVTDVDRLMDGKRAQLLHADPPYGMGKASDGVANDNLYEDDLDRFQMEWWATFRTFMEDNASAYIWGNAPELWRLWCRRLSGTETLTIRNEIVWDKKAIPGMKSGLLTQYPEATERCLFFQIGEQFLGNVNSEDFPESWEPLRSYLASEAEAAGVDSKAIKEACGCGMFSHWFTRSQFTLIPEKHYQKLAATYPDRFSKPWKLLKAEWDIVKDVKVQGSRSYFDNAHDIMRDVWEFPRVTGDERHTHATPKPVALMERVMKSSLPKGGLCAEPFGGSGATLMGAEKSGRVCYTMELQGRYCDVIVKRWEDFTGKKAVLETSSAGCSAGHN
jgi:DNA modification methylase